MINESKSKKIISIRTPVVLYDKAVCVEQLVPKKCVTDFKEILGSTVDHTLGAKSGSTLKIRKVNQVIRNSKSFDLRFQDKGTCGKILMNEQKFVVLKSNRFQEQASVSRQKNLSYERLLNKMSARIVKFKSNHRVEKNEVYQDNLQIFAIRPTCSPLVPNTRKRFLSFYGAKRNFFYGN